MLIRRSEDNGGAWKIDAFKGRNPIVFGTLKKLVFISIK
jgi:hypothetical protein